MAAFFSRIKDTFALAKDSVGFLLVSIIVIAAIIVIAVIAEKLIYRGKAKKRADARYVAVCGIMSAMAAVLMLFEVALPFAPSFYKIDFSEIPVLIGAFSLGPVAGVIIELVKILLKVFFLKGTTTAFVGDFANFLIGCTFVVPASVIYHVHKTKKFALFGMGVGALIMTVFGSAFNAIYLIPKFAQLYGMPLDAIVAMGTAVNPKITSVTTLALFAVVPFNILKGALVTVITLLLYKHISPLLKGIGHK